jgi:hypothetical protein
MTPISLLSLLMLTVADFTYEVSNRNTAHPGLTRRSESQSHAHALHLRQQESSAQPTSISPSQWKTYVDPAIWASAAYCPTTRGQTVNTAKVLWNAGDGGDIPHTYVAYSETKNVIVVSHQGTNSTDLDRWELCCFAAA